LRIVLRENREVVNSTRGLDDRVSVRSWSDGTGYLNGQRTRECGGKRDDLRIERNSSSASEGKLDLIRR